MESLPKLCECGCNLPAPLSKQTDTLRGYVKGQPRRFRLGHHSKGNRFAKKSKRISIEDRGYKTKCHIWLLYVTDKGYGIEWNPRLKRMDFAHRVAYERDRRIIDTGKEIDHLCNQ
jgi:hypothetical protein